MIKNILRFSALIFFNYLVIFNSDNINVEQLVKDLKLIFKNQDFDIAVIYLFITVSVSALTLMVIYFLNPFIEVYLMYYLRYSFYFLINLVSVSTIYIVYRIYGYSRLFLLIYLFLSSLIMYLSDKKINFKNNN
tara:strand:- start:5651 stop:6052 length:402 start_codon:yes stop_codon:yes gene_type:complete